MELEGFLAPLPGPNPSGLDLRNEARFHAIERLLEPAARAERAAAEKASGPGSVPLDWADVLAQATDLATIGRDLRLLAVVARAMANDDGLGGLARGLGLLKDTVATHWDTVHPMLRDSPSRREAAIRRIAALKQLENADNGLLCDLEFNVVLRPRGLGLFTGADLAAGSVNRATFVTEAPGGLGEKEMAGLIAAHEARVARVATACKAMAAEQPGLLDELIEKLASARAALAGLEEALNARVEENGVRVLFTDLAKLLSRMEQSLQAGKSAPPVAPAAAASAPPAQGTPVMTQPAAAAAMNGATVPGQINSRAEVEKCLDLIIDFYERTEPSSPIPHLARRMRKMVPMNFMQLMEEIAPSGMKEFRNVAGVYDEKAK